MEIEQLVNKPALAKAVVSVMKAVDGVEKSMTVGKGSSAYKGVSDKDVKTVYKKAMASNGLCILPVGVEDNIQIDRWEEEDSYNKGVMKQKQSVFTSVKTKYLLLHESGESVILSGYGHGIDSQDKGAGKATTYALKYALLYTFMTPTGDLDDSDTTHSSNLDVPKKAPSAPKPPASKPFLNQNTEDWTKVTKALSEGKATIAQVKLKFALSKINEEELTKLLPKK